MISHGQRTNIKAFADLCEAAMKELLDRGFNREEAVALLSAGIRAEAQIGETAGILRDMETLQ